MRISAHGLALDVPPGWDARIRQLRQATDQFRAHPVLHAADFPLSEERGDIGSGVVEAMRPTNAFVALIEHHPDSANTALFSKNTGMTRELRADDFSPRQLQRTIRGQAGTQSFFVDGGRAFCLYVVLGRDHDIQPLLDELERVLSTITIEPAP